MRVNKQSRRSRCPQTARQRGHAAVEFAFVAVIYFTLIFGMLELARALYICNALQEVTRRAAVAAVNTDFSVPGALSQVQVKAIFRSKPGLLPLGDPISDTHIHIEYMWIERVGNTLRMKPITAMPASPAANKMNCAADPNSDGCI